MFDQFSDFSFLRVAFLALATLAVAVPCYLRLTTMMQRGFLVAVLLGLYVYSGFGAAHAVVPVHYLVYFSIFTMLMAVAFTLTVKASTRGVLKHAGVEAARVALFLKRPLLNKTVVVAYICCVSFPLVYPEMRLDRLWHPPAIDMISAWNNGIAIDSGIVNKYLTYVGDFLYPFYLVIIFQFLPKIHKTLLFLVGPIYINYCDSAYIGRSNMAMVLLIFLLTLVFSYPHKMRLIAVLTLIALPAIMVASAGYTYIRAEKTDYRFMSVPELVVGMIYDETRFPLLSPRVIQSGSSVDLLQYGRYVLLYPVPGEKLDIAGRIAEHITNIRAGQEGFSVELVGPVSESVYLFGGTFFWLQALFVGVVFGLLCRLSESIARFPVIGAFFISLIGYKFARAGVSAVWPIISFHMLPFYLVFFTNAYYRRIPTFPPQYGLPKAGQSPLN